MNFDCADDTPQKRPTASGLAGVDERGERDPEDRGEDIAGRRICPPGVEAGLGGGGTVARQGRGWLGAGGVVEDGEDISQLLVRYGSDPYVSLSTRSFNPSELVHPPLRPRCQ